MNTLRRPVRFLDNLLNGVTMYRLVLYGLVVLCGAGIALSFLHVLPLSGAGLLASLGICVWGCYVVNKAMSWAWSAATNTESWLITALILCCILPPATTVPRALTVFLAALLAMASKYMLAFRGKHVCNPAALAAVVIGLTGLPIATWWVGSKAMLPFTLIVGLLVVRKLRRFQVVFIFVLAALAVMLVLGVQHGRAVPQILEQSVTSWPLIFFATIMLTEPSTMPPHSKLRVWLGALVGMLFASQLHIGPVYSTPEVALVAGNLFAYIVSPKYKVLLRLKEKRQLAPNIFDFVFQPQRSFSFQPGQYMEWTLPHKHTDDRGNRRTFTIASSPTEADVHLGVKFYQPSSSFKTALAALQPGSELIAGQLAGDFVLPKNPARKLAFVAGGIGITPFRSQLKYLIDRQERRDVVLIYMVRDMSEVSYQDVLRDAQIMGVRVEVATTPLTPGQFMAVMPDYKERMWYISGPNAMVEAYRDSLRDAGISSRHIKTDYFAGY